LQRQPRQESFQAWHFELDWSHSRSRLCRMFFCPDCHVSNRTDAKFCRKCGKSRTELERTETRDEAISSKVESGSVVEAPKPVQEEMRAAETGSAPQSTNAAQSTNTAPSVNAAQSTNTAPSVSAAPSGSAGQDTSDSTQAAPGHTHTEEGRSERSDAPALSVRLEEEGVSLSAPPDVSGPECPNCWRALRATDKFCCWCGEAQPNRVLPFLKLCLECSTFLPEKANFCYSCGTDVGYSSRRKVKVPHELFKDEDSEFFPRFNA